MNPSIAIKVGIKKSNLIILSLNVIILSGPNTPINITGINNISVERIKTAVLSGNEKFLRKFFMLILLKYLGIKTLLIEVAQKLYFVNFHCHDI
jgi:hypothetical protein